MKFFSFVIHAGYESSDIKENIHNPLSANIATFITRMDLYKNHFYDNIQNLSFNNRTI